MSEAKQTKKAKVSKKAADAAVKPAAKTTKVKAVKVKEVVPAEVVEASPEAAEPDIGKSRLMGSNIYFSGTGAALDITLSGQDLKDMSKLIKLYEVELERIMQALNWSGYKTGIRVYSKGFKYALSAPADLLFCAIYVLRQTGESAYNQYKTGEPNPIQDILEYIEPEIKSELDLKYRAICDEARRRSLNVFLEKYDICIGSGKYAYRADIDDIILRDIPWDEIKEVPSVMVTGTNGKTTTVRLTAYIARHAGKKVGYCSTDWVMVGDEIVEKGDLSGPTGSLRVMMHPEVELAVLEVARGGLVRRGLIADYVRGATVTNVSEDHLGQDGIENLEDMAESKSLVYDAVRAGGYRVINLDDDELRKRVSTLPGKKILITQRPLTNKDVKACLKYADHVCYIKDNAFYWKTGDTEEMVATFEETPITVNGMAKHNVENAMNAICLSYILGLTKEQITEGLRTYENTAENNHGRANTFKHNGGTIIVDFAHNPAAIGAILNMAHAYLKPGGKLSMLVGNTGNRLKLTDGICQMVVDAKVDTVMIKEIPNYLRGAKLGQIPKMIEDSLLEKGLKKKQIIMIGDEETALEHTLDTMQPGDVCAFLCHSNTGHILEELNKRTQLM